MLIGGIWPHGFTIPGEFHAGHNPGQSERRTPDDAAERGLAGSKGEAVKKTIPPLTDDSIDALLDCHDNLFSVLNRYFFVSGDYEPKVDQSIIKQSLM
jgi:hypothetical protein